MKYLVLSIIMISNLSLSVEPKKEIDEFFKLLNSGKSQEAVDRLFSSNKWMKNQHDQVSAFKEQTGLLKKDLLGELNGFVLLGNKTFKKIYMSISYIALYERQPIRFKFEFYKPNDEWQFNGFSFDTEVADEIESASNHYFIEDNVK